MLIVMIVAFQMTTQKGYIPFYFIFFQFFWFVRFFDFFPFFEHSFPKFTLLKQSFPISSIFFVATGREFTKKNRFSVQNFFCFMSLDLFAMTLQVTSYSLPRLLQS